MPMKFRITRPGSQMGVLTIPKGTPMYRRKDGERQVAKKEFDALALPTTAPGGAAAWSIRLGDQFYYIPDRNQEE